MSGRRALAAQAEEYLANGWSVLPVEPGGKRPASRAIRATRGLPGWRVLGEVPADLAELSEWLRVEPEAGIGVLTGRPSNGLVVVDVDDPAAAPELPRTACWSTPRGAHYLFRSVGEDVRSRRLTYGDLRASGGYVVAPTTQGRFWLRTPAQAGIERFSADTYIHSTSTSVQEQGTGFLGSGLLDRAAAPVARGRVLPDWLVDLDCDPTTALRLTVALGAPEGVRLGEPFLCPVHVERKPSVALWQRGHGERCLLRHFHAEPAWLSLAQARAYRAGRTGRLSASELACWKLRLAHEACLLDVPTIDEPGAGDALAVVWHGFRLLVELRRLVDGGAPTPFSARFAASWCGLSTRSAHGASRELSRRGLMVAAGFDQRGTSLWRPHTTKGA